MEDNSNFCSNCGKPWEETLPETAEQTAPETAPAEEVIPAEEETSGPEIREGIKATPGKIAMAVAAVVLVIALIVALIGGMAPAAAPEETAPSTQSAEAAEPTDLFAVEATVPADGNPKDVTCKGSYTADDETVLAAGDSVWSGFSFYRP